jgi:hypothetical protein
VTSLRRASDVLFGVCLFSLTFSKLKWDSLGGLSATDGLTVLFVAMFAGETVLAKRCAIPRAATVVVAFSSVLLATYLVAALGLESRELLLQFAKGAVKFGLHSALLAAGIAYLAARPASVYLRGLGFLCGGVAANAAYGVLQLVVEKTGRNLDAVVLTPLTGEPARTMIWHLDAGPPVVRTTGLTTDPNHLGIMLLVPILLLAPFFLRASLNPKWRGALGALLAALLVVEATTLSRSALLGLAVGSAILGVKYASELRSRAALAAAGAATAVIAALVARDPDFYRRVLTSRSALDDPSSLTHVHQYDFIPRALGSDPLFGIGLNTFARAYAPITGKEDFTPHSFYVQAIVETGAIGSAVFAGFLAYVAVRLRRLHSVASALPGSEAIPAKPLAWGLTAALAGTMAANAFYLTMTFYYFYGLLLLAVAAADQPWRKAAPRAASPSSAKTAPSRVASRSGE